MTHYYKLLCAGALIFSGIGCTEVDDRLGENLLPPNQRMKVEVITFDEGVKTYLYRTDSLPSSRLGSAWLGRMSDPAGVWGAQSNSAMLQFLPTMLPYGEDAMKFGMNPIVDSMSIFLTLDGTRGESAVEQSFAIYDIDAGDEWFSRDSIYHVNFPIEQYRGEKLFDFSHSGKGNVDTRLFPTAAGKEFIDRIVNVDWETYKDDSLFRREFRGLYVTPAEGSPRDASILKASLASSGIRLHMRNHDSLDVTAIYDTLALVFSFRDNDGVDATTGLTVQWDNVSVNLTSFDYAGSVLGALEAQTGGFTDTLPTSPTQPVAYVQTMGGVGTYVRFSEELIESLKALQGDDDHDVMVNQAVMTMWLEDGSSTPLLDAAVGRLGSYLSIGTLRPIPDYQYTFEENTRQQDSSYTLPYDGYLNRSNARYELDISSYIQRLAEGKVPPVMMLGPDVAGRFGFGATAMSGTGGDRPITIRLTYTIIDR